MAIKMIDEANESRPYVFCDWCGERIKDARDGNFEWKMDTEVGIANGTLFFTHKECCLPFEDKHGGRATWASDELNLLPTFLKNNMRTIKAKPPKPESIAINTIKYPPPFVYNKNAGYKIVDKLGNVIEQSENFINAR